MRIEWNEEGFDELLTGPGTQALIEEHAVAMAAEANTIPSTTLPPVDYPYYDIEDGSDEHRARRRIHTTTERAAGHEAKTHALQRAMGAASVPGLGTAARYTR